jgi:hypothetical protein
MLTITPTHPSIGAIWVFETKEKAKMAALRLDTHDRFRIVARTLPIMGVSCAVWCLVILRSD